MAEDKETKWRFMSFSKAPIVKGGRYKPNMLTPEYGFMRCKSLPYQKTLLDISKRNK